ncbi:hypothetical protein RUND412_002498 [Rhizina undulata]
MATPESDPGTFRHFIRLLFASLPFLFLIQLLASHISPHQYTTFLHILAVILTAYLAFQILLEVVASVKIWITSQLWYYSLLEWTHTQLPGIIRMARRGSGALSVYLDIFWRFRPLVEMVAGVCGFAIMFRQPEMQGDAALFFALWTFSVLTRADPREWSVIALEIGDFLIVVQGVVVPAFRLLKEKFHQHFSFWYLLECVMVREFVLEGMDLIQLGLFGWRSVIWWAVLGSYAILWAVRLWEVVGKKLLPLWPANVDMRIKRPTKEYYERRQREEDAQYELWGQYEHIRDYAEYEEDDGEYYDEDYDEDYDEEYIEDYYDEEYDDEYLG